MLHCVSAPRIPFTYTLFFDFIFVYIITYYLHTSFNAINNYYAKQRIFFHYTNQCIFNVHAHTYGETLIGLSVTSYTKYSDLLPGNFYFFECTTERIKNILLCQNFRKFGKKIPKNN